MSRKSWLRPHGLEAEGRKPPKWPNLKRLDTELTWRLYEVRTHYSEDRMSAENAFKILDQLNRQRQDTGWDLGRARSRLEDAERSAAAEERWATWAIEQKRAWIRAHTTALLVHPSARAASKRAWRSASPRARNGPGEHRSARGAAEPLAAWRIAHGCRRGAHFPVGRS